MSTEATAWLGRLPELVDDLRRRWSLTLEEPFDGPEVSAAWVARAIRADGTPAVLKVSIPHMEADHEIDGLRFWDGDPTVRLLDADQAEGAMRTGHMAPVGARARAGRDHRQAPSTDVACPARSASLPAAGRDDRVVGARVEGERGPVAGPRARSRGTADVRGPGPCARG